MEPLNGGLSVDLALISQPVPLNWVGLADFYLMMNVGYQCFILPWRGSHPVTTIQYTATCIQIVVTWMASQVVARQPSFTHYAEYTSATCRGNQALHYGNRQILFNTKLQFQ